ncbi:MAG TPA: hypothetical protein EYP85_10745 [Armatimonadetes bacterium]|nr:hypothetical protein [Armatimonadota bacterium]
MAKDKQPPNSLSRDEERPPYRPPRVLLYSQDELLAQLGPVRACASFNPFESSTPPEGRGEKWFDFEV